MNKALPTYETIANVKVEMAHMITVVHRGEAAIKHVKSIPYLMQGLAGGNPVAEAAYFSLRKAYERRVRSARAEIIQRERETRTWEWGALRSIMHAKGVRELETVAVV